MLNHCFASVADVTFPELARSIAVTTPTALARIGALTPARAVPTPDIPQLHVLHEGREERDRIPWAPVVMSAIVLGTSLFAALRAPMQSLEQPRPARGKALEDFSRTPLG